MKAPDHRLVLTSAFENVSIARAFVAAQLQGVGTDTLVSDLLLATSELVTNAIEHGQSGELMVDISVDGDCAKITVTSNGPSPGIDEPSVWTMAPAAAVVGRGLGIVHSLADRVWVHRDGDQLSVTLERRLHA